MTKGTKIFRITICILLALTMLATAFFSLALVAFAKVMVLTSEYGIWVAGEAVTRENKKDILGDGTVSYNATYNIITFENAVIEYDYTILQSEHDLTVNLIGENKFVCEGGEYITAVAAGGGHINNDLSIEGDGSLTIELKNISGGMQGIIAENLTIGADVTVITNNCDGIMNGIVAMSRLYVVNGATITVNSGSAQHSTAVRAYGNALLEQGTAMNISASSGSTETCKGLSVNGDLILGKNAQMNVTLEDTTAQVSECIRVTGTLDVGVNATISASAKNTYGIECYGAIKVNQGSTVSAKSEAEGADILCYGAFVNYGASVSADIDALGGVHNK